MRAVVQRAVDANVAVDGAQVGGFAGLGLVALVGVTHTDNPAIAGRLAAKIYNLRIFDTSTLAAHGAQTAGHSEQSALDLQLPVLVVSQFTLYANTKKGRRPTWDAAAPREFAEPLVDRVASELAALGAKVSTGVFGAEMAVSLANIGPVTIILDVDD